MNEHIQYLLRFRIPEGISSETVWFPEDIVPILPRIGETYFHENKRIYSISDLLWGIDGTVAGTTMISIDVICDSESSD
jgi:hypothetical protein